MSDVACNSHRRFISNLSGAVTEEGLEPNPMVD